MLRAELLTLARLATMAGPASRHTACTDYHFCLCLAPDAKLQCHLRSCSCSCQAFKEPLGFMWPPGQVPDKELELLDIDPVAEAKLEAQAEQMGIMPQVNGDGGDGSVWSVRAPGSVRAHTAFALCAATLPVLSHVWGLAGRQPAIGVLRLDVTDCRRAAAIALHDHYACICSDHVLAVDTLVTLPLLATGAD